METELIKNEQSMN